MKRWLRQHRYALAIAVRRLLAQPFSSLSNLLAIALALSVPIVGTAILLAAQPVAREVSVSPEITLFMKRDAPTDAVNDINSKLRNEFSDDVVDTRIVTRQQAYKTLQRNPNWADALSVLPENPLPDSIVVTLAESANLASRADTLVKTWREWSSVDLVQHDSAWVQRLEALLRFVRIGLGLLALGVALVVLATVFNTVRMQALAQREEIAVARLVGATESFVRRPFLYLGALIGLLASLVAIGLSALALSPLNAALAQLARSYGSQLALQLPNGASLALATLAVVILGAISALWSVNRNTRF
ncbi:ABC transporter permease [Pusillimonas sp. CC-YST705]|uniref:Cell division protein FtsX n=1 Tax=Mesopusillimonas faecipullorum TaxID=2755040 RepID=A0ABS8CBZ5_9BURK|nr:ABC transporter permease [Mesopusillimonas faecipullorum]MCB5363555.1 ABC transporter permease [Mesopusillimonas faecipullorum]